MAVTKIVKLNYDRKVRYIFDRDTEECDRLSEEVMDHYGQFLAVPNAWWMADIKSFQKELRTCGLSVREFLSKEFPKQEPPEAKPKRKPRKKTASKEESKPVKKKAPVKKKTVKRKSSIKRKKA
jgi:hypothetical protein